MCGKIPKVTKFQREKPDSKKRKTAAKVWTDRTDMEKRVRCTE